MVQKQIDHQSILRLISEGRRQRDIAAILSCGNNLLVTRFKALQAEGLIEKSREHYQGSAYQLTPKGLKRIGGVTPEIERVEIKTYKPKTWVDEGSEEGRPAPMSAAEIAALRLSIPENFTISIIKPHLFLAATNPHPYYLNFKKINLMRFASRADAVIAANRLAEVIKWLNSPKFLDVMHDILLSADCVSPFYDNALNKMQRRQQASWAK